MKLEESPEFIELAKKYLALVDFEEKSEFQICGLHCLHIMDNPKYDLTGWECCYPGQDVDHHVFKIIEDVKVIIIDESNDTPKRIGLNS